MNNQNFKLGDYVYSKTDLKKVITSGREYVPMLGRIDAINIEGKIQVCYLGTQGWRDPDREWHSSDEYVISSHAQKYIQEYTTQWVEEVNMLQLPTTPDDRREFNVDDQVYTHMYLTTPELHDSREVWAVEAVKQNGDVVCISNRRRLCMYPNKLIHVDDAKDYLIAREQRRIDNAYETIEYARKAIERIPEMTLPHEESEDNAHEQRR